MRTLHLGGMALAAAVALTGCETLQTDGFLQEDMREEARRACVDYARDHGVQLIEVERVEPAGRGVYDVYLRVRTMLIASRTDRCTYDARSGEVIIAGVR